MVENRRVGIKSRETYECPGALALILAHQDLESITYGARPHAREGRLEPRYAELVYDGLWFSPLREAIDAFVELAALRHRRRAPAARAGAAAPWPVGGPSAACTTTTSPPTTPTTRSATRTPTGFVRLWGLVGRDVGPRAGRA